MIYSDDDLKRMAGAVRDVCVSLAREAWDFHNDLSRPDTKYDEGARAISIHLMQRMKALTPEQLLERAAKLAKEAKS